MPGLRSVLLHVVFCPDLLLLGSSSPFSNPECRYLASSSKDGSIRVWDTVLGRCEKIMTGHTQSVTCVKWGGDGLLYTSSQDRTVKVWRAKDVSVCVLMHACVCDGTLWILVATHRNTWMWRRDMCVYCCLGCTVQDSAGSRPLGEHPGSQHRLRPAHGSFWTCFRHHQPPGRHRIAWGSSSFKHMGLEGSFGISEEDFLAEMFLM